MEDILRPIYQERASDPNTLGVLLIEKSKHSIPTTAAFDAVLLMIIKDGKEPVYIKHYSYGEKKAALHIVTEEKLRNWLILGSNKIIFDWLYNGKLLFDRNDYTAKLKEEVHQFPFYGRKLKMGLEFSKLIRRYMDGKAFFEKQHFLDAYNHVIHSLHHLARLAVIENGFHPEVTVWSQVKQIEPEIYKLYVELVTSDESLEKRLELLFLASEFLIHSKTKVGINHLYNVLEEKEEWLFNEILVHDELVEYSVDLEVLLDYLIDRGYMDVKNVETKGRRVFHRYYFIAKKLS